MWLSLSLSLSLFVYYSYYFFVSLLFSYSHTLHYYIRMVVSIFSFCLFHLRVCVFLVQCVCVQSQIRVVSSSSIYLSFSGVSLNALDRDNTLTNSDTHTSRPNLFFCVCLSYIHTSYLFCTCALRVLLLHLLLLSSLSLSLSFFFYVVICCHCRLLLCLNFSFPLRIVQFME